MVRAKADSRNTLFSGKEYKDGIDDLAKKTVVRASDLDEKAIKFLDYLQQNGGRGKEACQHLKQALEGLTREHVSNWRAYVYTILRGFDKDAYEAMKIEEGKRVRPPRGPRTDKVVEKKDKFPLTSSFAFNPAAPEFVPGNLWPAALAAPAAEASEAATVPAVADAGELEAAAGVAEGEAEAKVAEKEEATPDATGKAPVIAGGAAEAPPSTAANGGEVAPAGAATDSEATEEKKD